MSGLGHVKPRCFGCLRLLVRAWGLGLEMAGKAGQ